MVSQHPDEQDGVAIETEQKQKLEHPRRFRVLLQNDDFTTMEFVVHLLRAVFHKSDGEAIGIMLHVHEKGVGVAGVYSRQVAETKVETVKSMAEQAEYPLQCTLEPD